MTDLRPLTDQQLSFALRQLELRIAALRYATSALGQALYQQFLEKREAALAEQERRDSTMSNPTVRTARTGNWRRVYHPNCRIARIGKMSRACRPIARTSGIDSSRRDTSRDDRRQGSGN
jgi:hypothetical protein